MEFQREMNKKLIFSILAAALMTFAGIVVETSMNITFPTLMTEFGVDTATVQWSTTAYLLVLSLIIPSSPFLIRRFRMKHLFVSASIIFIIGTVTCMTAPAFSVLLLGRIIQGIGTGIALPLMYNIILTQAPHDKMGFLVGIASMIPGVAPAIGPFFGGAIMLYFGWRAIFLCLLPILAVSFLFGITSIRQSIELSKTKIDKNGYLLIGICFVCLIFALNQAGTLGWVHPVVLLLYAATVIILVFFVRHCRRCDAPLIHVQVFSYNRYTFSLLAYILLMMVALGIGFLLPNFSQICIGLNTFQAGVLLLPGCGLAALLNPVSGKIYDKNGAKKLARIASVLAALGIFLYFISVSHASFALLTGIYVIFGAGMGSVLGVMITNGLQGLPEKYNPDGNAVYNTLQQLFAAIGTTVAASIVAAAQSSVPDDLSAGTVNGTRMAFFLFFIITLIIIVLVYRASEKAADASHVN